MSLITLPSWRALTEHQPAVAQTTLRDLFSHDPGRFNRFSMEAAGLHLDYSRHRINDDTLNHLLALAEERGLNDGIRALFAGHHVNNTEDRPALHTALRRPVDAGPLPVDGEDLQETVQLTLSRMEAFVDDIHEQRRVGYTGKPLRTIVNIGIGGSFLGPKVVSDALKPYWRSGYNLHYIANIDGASVAETCAELDPETTLFVICSKSFGTLETLKNAEAARRWFLSTGATQDDISRHFIAVSTNVEKATEFGIDPDNLFPLWDWVGGRYSLWSAIGLPQAIVVGMDRFRELLAGGHAMDEHFRTAPLRANMPVIQGLLGIWYQNFWGAEAHAVLAYDESLSDFPAHLQQMDMESNGKRVTHDAAPVEWNTGSVIWGGTGTNGQHAYHQLLHQGTRLIPVDFLMPLRSHYDVDGHHDWLFANFVGQQQALLEGRTETEIVDELMAQGKSEATARALAPHKVIPGNQPHSTITFEQLTPETLGALIALYEHKVFVQGHIWDINPFDQWGVELGKVLGNSVYDALQSGDLSGYDSSTAAMIRRYLDHR